MRKKKYQVFISSTFKDLIEERSKISQILPSIDCIPTGMEIFTPSSKDIWSTIEQYLTDCDYYVLIIGGRYGSLSSDGTSFTEKEYNLAVEKQIPIIAMLHKDVDSLEDSKKDEDPETREKLNKFIERITLSQTPGYWADKNELALQVFSAISQIKINNPRSGWIRDEGPDSESLLEQLNLLRQEKEKLIEKMNELQKQNQVDLDLADINDKYKFSGSFKYPLHPRIEKWSYLYSWQELFAELSPFLLKAPNDESVRIRINALFKELTKRENVVSFELGAHSFETIRIQLEALSLIKVEYLNSTTGRPAWFWKLTEKGKYFMLSLRTIQKPKD